MVIGAGNVLIAVGYPPAGWLMVAIGIGAVIHAARIKPANAQDDDTK